MKINLSNYTPVQDRLILDEPSIELKTIGGIDKAESTIKQEKANWVKEGKPLKVAKDFRSSDGKESIKEGEYVLLANEYGIIHIDFEDGGRWQIPYTSIAGKLKI